MFFVQIKPCNSKELNDFLLEKAHKLASPSEYEYHYSIKNDMINELNNIIIIHNLDDPIKYINLYFEQKNVNLEQKYNILAYDINLDIYYIMFVDILYNNSNFLSSLNDEERNSNFNIIASNLAKHYNNSLAIFGDVFIIGINKKYYDNDGENNNKMEIYDFTKDNLIDSFTNINFVKILIKPNNNIIAYNRDILNSYIENNKYELLENNIIKCNHNNIIIYIKFCETLKDSFKNILYSMPDSIKSKDNIYLINLLDNDIDFLLKIN